jgi:AcrR family transcriptional regulator
MNLSIRDKILFVTARLIASEGLDAVSIRNVCTEAKIKAPTVYHYFGDKNGLIDAVISISYQNYIKKHHNHVKNSTPLKALVKSWDIFFDFVEENTELFHAIVMAHLRQKIPQEGYELFLSIAEIFKKLENQKKLKLDYYTSAHIFYSTSYGLALAYIAQNKAPRLKKNIRLTRDICIRGLLAN